MDLSWHVMWHVIWLWLSLSKMTRNSLNHEQGRPFDTSVYCSAADDIRVSSLGGRDLNGRPRMGGRSCPKGPPSRETHLSMSMSLSVTWLCLPEHTHSDWLSTRQAFASAEPSVVFGCAQCRP
ncbi:uncharacterized protein B0J16DRAFT_326106 [Fusarium flagelliforme]|uniref:uncharacterized protein n=1 Tax=Fusarium flagelliforme TaxID=2675880 RepID=UPI001E8D3B72|nr:uncharacterized protein B0J16DRAFT_326106 [Fusarium flagelliforme]KAH7196536.1 hypothetical protein B0J16DRAFT_326106 [Fusarium flagelliforme]